MCSNLLLLKASLSLEIGHSYRLLSFYLIQIASWNKSVNVNSILMNQLWKRVPLLTFVNFPGAGILIDKVWKKFGCWSVSFTFPGARMVRLTEDMIVARTRVRFTIQDILMCISINSTNIRQYVLGKMFIILYNRWATWTTLRSSTVGVQSSRTSPYWGFFWNQHSKTKCRA